MRVPEQVRRVMWRLRPPVLALGGGGARGFVHIGVMRTLDELSSSVTAVVGTSMGAVMGAMYLALGSSAEVEARWREALARGLLPQVGAVRMVPWAEKREHPLIQVARRIKNRVVVSFALNRATVLDGELLDAAVDFLVPDVAIEDLPLPFVAVATDLESGAEVRLDRGPLRLAVKASSSIPGMVPAKVVDGRQLVDGGVIAEVPVAAARTKGRPVLVVDASMEIPPPGPEDFALDTMMRTQMMTSRLLRLRQLEEATWVLRPAIGHVAWADWGGFDALVAAGEIAAREFFGLPARPAGPLPAGEATPAS
ncbi:MAG TPA: patatin-like phospholipase family protein [Methylomirabilota bacterium]|nr:patatin-like phospholipase family protein [Methylomirabilota bacterium]